MKRDYELVVIFDGSVPEDVAVKEKEAFEAFLTASGTENQTATVWGKRQLAYDIAKKKSGYYYFFQFTAEGTIVDKIDRNLKLNPKALRFMTVVADTRPFMIAPEELAERGAIEGEEE